MQFFILFFESQSEDDATSTDEDKDEDEDEHVEDDDETVEDAGSKEDEEDEEAESTAGDEEREFSDGEEDASAATGEGEGEGEGETASTQTDAEKRPALPLFSFPPSPRAADTEAEQSIQVRKDKARSSMIGLPQGIDQSFFFPLATEQCLQPHARCLRKHSLLKARQGCQDF